MNVSRVRVERIKINPCFVEMEVKDGSDCDEGGFAADIRGMSNPQKLYRLPAPARIFRGIINGECRFRETTAE